MKTLFIIMIIEAFKNIFVFAFMKTLKLRDYTIKNIKRFRLET